PTPSAPAAHPPATRTRPTSRPAAPREPAWESAGPVPRAPAPATRPAASPPRCGPLCRPSNARPGVPLQAPRPHHTLDVVRHGGEVVTPVGRDRFTPAALVHGDAPGAPVDPIDHVIPGVSRAAQVVQEDAGRLTGAALGDSDCGTLRLNRTS